MRNERDPERRELPVGIVAEAEAQARANDLLSRSITNTLVQYEMAKRWNGQMPQVTGGAMPMLQLPGSKQPE